MGESFLGLPNRFKIINDLLESTYNPNHALSAYQGHKISEDYVKRSGGEKHSMMGDLVTLSLYPIISMSADIGKPSVKYNNVYASRFHGNADTATKLQSTKTIKLTGSVTGEVTTDLSGNVTINTTTNHNHDSLYLKLTGGTLKGSILIGGSICPNGPLYNLGTISQVWRNVYAETINAKTLTGNASTASKLAEARTITVSLTPSSSTSSNSGSAAFDGSKDVSINVNAPYFPIDGGNIYGNILFLPGNGIRDNNNHEILGYSSSSHYDGLYDIHIGKSLWNVDEKAGQTNIYSNILPVYIKTKGTYDALELKSDGAAYVYMGCSNNGSYIRSLYYDDSNALNINTLRIPLKSGEDLDYNGNTIYHSGNLDPSKYISMNGGTLSGNISPKLNDTYYLGDGTYKFKGVYATNLYGNADTATKLQTARTLTIGNTAKQFDGSSDVSWSLTEIGAADANVVSKIGTQSGVVNFNYAYSSGDSKELGDMDKLTFYGDSYTARTLEAGTYIIISRVVGKFLARYIGIGIAVGSNLSNLSVIESSMTILPSNPIIVADDKTTVRPKNNEYQHKVQSMSIQTFTTNTVVAPYFAIEPSPNWGGALMYYTLTLQYIRIK